MKKTVLLILFTAAVSAGLQAQTSIGPATVNSGGGYHYLGLNEFEWSIGEMTLVSTYQNGNIVVTQGVLQPEYYAPAGVTGVTVLNDVLKVFPNPATSIVNIQYSAANNASLSFALMDIGGKIIRRSTVAVTSGLNNTQVNVADLAAATYMLQVTVTEGDKVSVNTSYKIEKLN